MRALEPTLAKQAAGTDGDGRLDDVVTRAERIRGRVEQRHDALALVIVQHAPGEWQRRSTGKRQGDEDFPVQPCEKNDKQAG